MLAWMFTSVSWNAAVFLDGVYVRNIHQPPSPKALHSFLTSNFPGADYRSVPTMSAASPAFGITLIMSSFSNDIQSANFYKQPEFGY
jgi:hypothetical protein